MRTRRLISFTALLTIVACGAPPPTETSMTELTSRDLAGCLEAVDQPICLLRLTERDALTPVSLQEEFLNAPEIVAAIEAGWPEDERGARQLDPERAALYQPVLDLIRVRNAALDSDRRGVEPEEALRPIRELAVGRPARELLGGQIHYQSGAEARATAYQSLIGRVKTPWLYQGLEPPSDALIAAALRGLEHELTESDISAYHNPSITLEYLAGAYATVGDADGVRRAHMHTKRYEGVFYSTFSAAEIEFFVEIDILLRMQRLEEAVDLVTSSLDPDFRDDIPESAARRVLATLHRSNRPDLVGPIFDILAADPENWNSFQSEVFAFAIQGAPPELIRPWLERWDQSAQHELNFEAGRDARRALEGWLYLGEIERVDTLLEIWTEHARSQLGAECGSRGDPPGTLCAAPVREYMLARLDRLDEAFENPSFRISKALQLDLDRGRGLRNIDTYLTHARGASDVESVYAACLAWASRNQHWDLAIIEPCIEHFMEVAAAREPREHPLDPLGLDSDAPTRRMLAARRQGLGPHRATSKALRTAAQALRRGNQELALRLLDASLRIWSTAPEASMGVESDFVRRIAIAQLREEGRL